MRKRLTIAIVALVVGALVVAGAGALLISRLSAQQAALSQLRQQATVVAKAAPSIKKPRLLSVLARLLRLEDARFVVIGPAGRVRSPLPAGVSAGSLQPSALLSGEVVSGSAGSLVFVAEGVDLSPELAGFLPGGQLVVVLTRRVGGLAASWVYLLLVGAGTVAIAAGVASWLSLRLARPVRAVEQATTLIAGGELSVRVPVSGTDVPEMETLARSVNQMAASLEGSRERERQLLLSVAHDLRTPLTSIRGYAEAIEEGVTDLPAEAARVIGKEAARLERLVGDLLDLAKLDSKRLSLVLEDVDVGEVASSVVAALAEEARRKDISLVAVVEAGPGAGGESVVARADSDRLGQIVANLVDNALSFARSSVRVIAGRTNEANDLVALSVEDDGPGIGAAELSQVFDRFYTGDGSREKARRGSGLGLSIVSELAHAMGGTVRAESPVAEGGGTRMVVLLRRGG